MNLFLENIKRFSKPSIMLFSFLLFALVLISVNVFFAPNFKYLTQSFNYTPERAYLILSEYGEAGRMTHLKVLAADIIMVILYTIFFSTAIYSTFSRILNYRAMVSVLCIIPFILALIQALEVLGVFTLLISYPNRMFRLARIVNIITMAKFTCTYICFLLPFIGVIGLIIKRIFVKI